MLIFKVLWKEKCVTEVSCVYILVFGRVVFIFPYQMYHRTFSASCGSDVMPDRTGLDQGSRRQWRLLSLHLLYFVSDPAFLLFLFSFFTIDFYYRVTQLFKSTSIQVAECREEGLSLADWQGKLRESCLRCWSEQLLTNGVSPPSVMATPPSNTHAASLVVCMPYVLHIVYIFI